MTKQQLQPPSRVSRDRLVLFWEAISQSPPGWGTTLTVPRHALPMHLLTLGEKLEVSKKNGR